MMKISKLGFLLFLFAISTGLQAQFAITNPAEFEKNEGVLLVWDYAPSRDSITANIARITQTAGLVWIVYYPGAAPADTSQIRNYLYSKGVSPLNLSFIPGWTETLWIRDYGPFTAYASFGGGLQRYVIDAGYSQYNRPKDDSVPAQLANYWNLPLQTLGLEVEGGNLIFDGLGRGFGSKRIWAQNPDLTPAQISSLLCEKFNLSDFIFLDNLNFSGGGIWKHVDMFMKVIDYETIMVSSYPEHLPDYAVIEANVGLLANLSNYFGKPYNIIRIPAPPKANGSWATTENDEMRTYTNAFIINNTVIVPSYNLPEWDLQAKSIYEHAMPGYRIEMVDAQMLTILGGALHCVTKEVPSPHFNRIIHSKITGVQPYSDVFVVPCQSASDTLVEQMWLYYKVNQQTQYNKVPVQLICPVHLGLIENLQPNDTVQYYLELVSSTDTITYPGAAPDGGFTFWFDPVGIHEPLNEADGLSVFPNPAKSMVVLSGSNMIEGGKVRIHSASGLLVNECNASGDQMILSLDLQPGVYIISINSPHGNSATKLVIEKQ
ncbi:MAG: agmatine deiminase family protein [Bacteroidales bacterium]|nr:agmatine deiminase family protein [Bacteroidales bacterium]